MLQDTSLIGSVPQDLRGRIVIDGGVVRVSKELQGKASLDSFVSLARRRGVREITWHKPDEFDAKFRAVAQFTEGAKSNVQAYAVRLLRDAYECGASDIHITNYGAYGAVQMRRLGLLSDYGQLAAGDSSQLIRAIYETMTEAADSTFSQTERQDGRIVHRKFLPAEVHSVRVHTEPLECAQSENGNGTFMALRLLYDSTKATGTLEERVTALGYTATDASRLRFLTQRTGLTIISGPTGHGKSTLLKHVMESMADENPERNHMSVEDPPEYPLMGTKQIMVNTNGNSAVDPTERGRAYMNAIAGCMRSDPDVLMIGEIRYPEAAGAAIDAALTGHGVWATLHANNGFGIIRRMVSLLNAADYVNPLEYLCDHNVLAGLIYQRLVPQLCPECKVPLQEAQKGKHALPGPVFDRLLRVLDDPNGVHVRGDGCAHCRQLGITGQRVAAEVIQTDPTLLSHLRRDDFAKAESYWRHDLKGRSYVAHAVELIGAGQVDPHLAELRLGVPLDFDKMLHEGAAA